MLNLLLLEVDPGNTLGGSCLRDLVNVAREGHEVGEPVRQTMVLTTQTVDQAKFPSGTHFGSMRDHVMHWRAFCRKVQKSDTVVALISGHGYQVRDRNGDEMDGRDEYVRNGSVTILDDEFRSQLVDRLPLTAKFIGLVDTCHAGTMFDLDKSWNGKSWTQDSKVVGSGRAAYAIGACSDAQLDNCDIGNKAGFGGSLTVHLLDVPDGLKRMVQGGPQDIVDVWGELVPILKKLGQSPVLQTCDPDADGVTAPELKTSNHRRRGKKLLRGKKRGWLSLSFCC